MQVGQDISCALPVHSEPGVRSFQLDECFDEFALIEHWSVSVLEMATQRPAYQASGHESPRVQRRPFHVQAKPRSRFKVSWSKAYSRF